jgi:predicted Zn-dependent peptidase
VPYSHDDYFQARGAVGVLSDGMSSRLFTEIRENRGLAYSVYAGCHSLRDRGSVLCYAGTSNERAQETLDVLLTELARLADGVQEDELRRLKAKIKSALVMQQESSSARSSSIAADWYHRGRVFTLEELGRIVDELTCDTINRYLSNHPPKDFTIVTVGAEPLEINVGVS